MGRDATKQLEAGAGKAEAGATNALQAEANALRGQPTSDNTGVILVTVQPKDTIRSIGRFLYQRHLDRAPTDLELKEFVEDTAHRNKLSDLNLALDQKLYVKIPGTPSTPQRTEVAYAQPAQKAVAKGEVVAKAEQKPVAKPQPTHRQPERAVAQAQKTAALPKGEASRTAAATVPKTEAPKDETPKRTVASTTTATPETHRVVARTATTGQACSGYAQQIGNWITHNEAGHSAFAAYNPDDAGNGISVGLMQWNQKAGKLPDLIKAWHTKNPSKFEGMFGSYAEDMLSTNWVRSANFVGNRTLASGITQALNDREFQQVQLNMRNGHIRSSCELANDHRFTSVRGTAVVADLVNQIGPAGTARALRKVPKEQDMPSESQRIEALKRITGWRTNSGDRVGVIEERVKEIWRAEAAAAKAKGG